MRDSYISWKRKKDLFGQSRHSGSEIKPIKVLLDKTDYLTQREKSKFIGKKRNGR